METRLIAIPVCLMAATLLYGQQERTHQSAQKPPQATDLEVLQRVGIDRSTIDAA